MGEKMTRDNILEKLAFYVKKCNDEWFDSDLNYFSIIFPLNSIVFSSKSHLDFINNQTKKS